MSRSFLFLEHSCGIPGLHILIEGVFPEFSKPKYFYCNSGVVVP